MRDYLWASLRLFGTVSLVGRCRLVKLHASDTYDLHSSFFRRTNLFCVSNTPKVLKGKKEQENKRKKIKSKERA